MRGAVDRRCCKTEPRPGPRLPARAVPPPSGLLRLAAAPAAAAGWGGRAAPAGRLLAPPEVATRGHAVCRRRNGSRPRAPPCRRPSGEAAPPRSGRHRPLGHSPPKMAATAVPVPGGAGRPGLGKMAAAGASGRGGLGRAWVFSGWALGLCSLLASGTRPAAATTHWVVTEDGKIQQQVRGWEGVRGAAHRRLPRRSRPAAAAGRAPARVAVHPQPRPAPSCAARG